MRKPPKLNRRKGQPSKKTSPKGVEWLKESSPSQEYQNLCYLFRKDRALPKSKCKGPLRLSEQQFKVCQDEFVAHEISRFVRRIQGWQQKSKSFQNPVLWQDTDWEILGPRIEELRLQMYFARTSERYKAVAKEFDAIVRGLKPLQRKEHQIKVDPIGFVKYLANRHFIWSVLKGEQKAGVTLSKLQTHYSYLKDVPWAELLGKIDHIHPKYMLNLQNKPKDNAFIEISRKYNLSPESIPVLLSPSKLLQD